MTACPESHSKFTKCTKKNSTASTNHKFCTTRYADNASIYCFLWHHLYMSHENYPWNCKNGSMQEWIKTAMKHEVQRSCFFEHHIVPAITTSDSRCQDVVMQISMASALNFKPSTRGACHVGDVPDTQPGPLAPSAVINWHTGLRCGAAMHDHGAECVNNGCRNSVYVATPSVAKSNGRYSSQRQACKHGSDFYSREPSYFILD